MKKIILIHGFNKNKKDMIPLKKNLNKIGYEVILVDLPLTFQKIDVGISCFEKEIKKEIVKLKENEKINLVGHSTGGLIIRNFISNSEYKNKIDKCVLISTPSKGTELANIAKKISKSFVNIFKTLDSLRPVNINKLNLKSKTEIEVGAIAGNKNNLILGKLLKGENDGRVEVNSVNYIGLKDFIVVSYGHKEIHHKEETARLINNFFKKSCFK